MTRPTSRKPSRPGSAPRKQRPPQQTNAEESYYLKQMAAKTPMVVVLDNGDELEGAIEWYDKSSIKLTRADEPSLMIPKRYIRYIFKAKERRRKLRREGRKPL